MTKNIMKKLFIALLFSGASATAAIAGDLKIGVVSVERILTEAPQVDKVNTSMLERFGPQRDELKTMEKAITKLQEEYKRNELVMAKDKLNDLKKKVITKIQELKKKESVLGQEVATVRNQELAVLQNQVREIIDAVAKSDGYSLILSEGVAYTEKEFDITDKVLSKMKSAFKK